LHKIHQLSSHHLFTIKMGDQEEFPIIIELNGNFQPSIFDLSGTVPFELYLNTRRSVAHEQDPRDLVILTTGSIFDLSAALREGLLELVEDASKKAVPFHSNNVQVEEAQGGITSQSFITLPTDVKDKDRNIKSVPLYASSVLREAVRPGCKYRLQLCGKDLGVKWWGWGSTPDIGSNRTELPPKIPHRLVSGRSSCSRKFAVVSAVKLAPKLSIALSLEPDGNDIEKGGNETREVMIRITITNVNDQSITVKTHGDQPHLLKTGEVPNPRPRITDPCPNIQNLSFKNQETQEELMSDAPTFISPVAGGSGKGWGRREFLTLAPREQVARTVRLPEQFLTRVCTRGRKYRVSLRQTACWWAYGALDDIFGEGNKVLKTWPDGLELPMELESDDSVILRY